MKSRSATFCLLGLVLRASFHTYGNAIGPDLANPDDIAHTKFTEGAMVAHLPRRFSAGHKPTNAKRGHKEQGSHEPYFCKTKILGPSPRN